MISAARRSGVKGTYGERGEPANIPEVRKHSTYEGYNENDLLYIPQVRDELRKQGFDAVRVFDQLERDEIDALIVIGSPDQVVDPLKTQRRGQAMPDAAPADAPPFYMKSAQVLDTKIQGKAATADQVRAILKNPQNGIKAEELKWTGIEQAVERIAKENGGKVPKEALLRYLQEDGAVRLEEVRMGGSKKQWTQADIDQLEKEAQRTRDFTAYERAVLEYEDQQLGSDANNTGSQTKYGQYQIPGGENYREVVLAMPSKDATIEPHPSLEGKWVIRKEDGNLVTNPTTEGQVNPSAIRYWDSKFMAEQYGRPAHRQAYTSTHFPDTPNYVAHARLNERTDAAGKPGLFLEEIQSDRHQAGREKGYVDAAIRNEQEALLAKQTLSDGDLARIEEIKAMGQGDIPDAPFRKDWPVQMFKRALADAVGSGKEWIGWTTGETQAARYDLSKQIDQLQYSKDDQRLWATKGGQVVLTERVPENKIADYVGKEPAKRLLESKTKPFQDGSGRDYHEISGIDLKVGGEGMKGFYDQILPKEISKYVKQWGGQVEKGTIAGVEKANRTYRAQEWVEKDKPPFVVWDAKNEKVVSYHSSLSEAKDARQKLLNIGTPIWRVNITPQMRESIKKAGQALFVGGMAAVVAEQEEQ
jgi:hypothetical protein